MFKPKHRPKPGDVYQTRVAKECKASPLELVALGFKIELVLADSLYGESHPFVGFLDRLQLPWIIVIRSNYRVWMPEEAEITCTNWHYFERVFSDGTTEQRYIQATIFGRRLQWRYWLLTNDPATLLKNSTWSVMSHWDERRDHFDSYGQSVWLENLEHRMASNSAKTSWALADYRVTQYAQIERW